MPSLGERAYVYAKTCGIIGKSIIGKRVSQLETVSRLSELDRLIFPSSPKDLPEKELLINLEDRIIDRSVDSIIPIILSFNKPPEFLILLLRSYEFTDLKNALIAALEGAKTAPTHTDIGRFQTVRFDAWPDIPAMIKRSEFRFILDEKGVVQRELGGVPLQVALDRYYYSALWLSLTSLSKSDRFAAEKILSTEISLKNASWALRLRTYYHKNPEEVKLHLIDKPFAIHGGEDEKKHPKYKSKERSLAKDAIQSLEFPLDSIAAWSSWRWRRFLNPEVNGVLWTADPRYFQNAATRYLFRLARRYFRSQPFLMGTIFCYIKLKQFEEDILTSSAEGLGMGMTGKDIISTMGLEF